MRNWATLCWYYFSIAHTTKLLPFNIVVIIVICFTHSSLMSLTLKKSLIHVLKKIIKQEQIVQILRLQLSSIDFNLLILWQLLTTMTWSSILEYLKTTDDTTTIVLLETLCISKISSNGINSIFEINLKSWIFHRIFFIRIFRFCHRFRKFVSYSSWY